MQLPGVDDNRISYNGTRIVPSTLATSALTASGGCASNISSKIGKYARLADLLITHGTALARLEGMAQHCSVSMCYQLAHVATPTPRADTAIPLEYVNTKAC
jgi:hypothetical protein